MADEQPLRLLAESEDDLQILSAAVQDAVAPLADLKYDARRRRFTIAMNRFRWEASQRAKKGGERVRAIIGFDSVLGVKSRGLGQASPEVIVSLLSMSFEAGDNEPAGQIRLTFAGDGEILLDVECIDAMLVDTDAVWDARRRPDHDRRPR